MVFAYVAGDLVAFLLLGLYDLSRLTVQQMASKDMFVLKDLSHAWKILYNQMKQLNLLTAYLSD